MFAAGRVGHKDVCELLLSRGATFGPNNMMRTPLSIAAIWGKIEICKLFFSHGGDAVINEPDIDGNTALSLAAQNGDHAMCSLLLQHTLSNREEPNEYIKMTCQQRRITTPPRPSCPFRLAARHNREVRRLADDKNEHNKLQARQASRRADQLRRRVAIRQSNLKFSQTELHNEPFYIWGLAPPASLFSVTNTMLRIVHNLWRFLQNLVFESVAYEDHPREPPLHARARTSACNSDSRDIDLSVVCVDTHGNSISSPVDILEITRDLGPRDVCCVRGMAVQSDSTTTKRTPIRYASRREEDGSGRDAAHLITYLQPFQTTLQFPEEPFTTLLPSESGREGGEQVLLQIQVIVVDCNIFPHGDFDNHESVRRIRSVWLDSPAIVVVFFTRPERQLHTRTHTPARFQTWLSELHARGFREAYPVQTGGGGGGGNVASLIDDEPAIFTRGFCQIRASTCAYRLGERGGVSVFATRLSATIIVV